MDVGGFLVLYLSAVEQLVWTYVIFCIQGKIISNEFEDYSVSSLSSDVKISSLLWQLVLICC